MSKIADFCGSRELPPQLMSARNVLTLDYIVKSVGFRLGKSEEDHGFVVDYRFIRDYGEQPPEAIADTNRSKSVPSAQLRNLRSCLACAFVFKGSAKTSGKLWSPNHPGFYPRDLDCEYVFHGQDGQIVLIHFEYFDVEGHSA